ncbi:MAG: Fic family protein [Chloroflexi bacterium]|nr:Fic family protein [Chloroflexota bacterium]
MNPESFSEDAPGRVVRAPDVNWAFIPAPLPPQLEIGQDLSRSISEADRALGELRGVVTNLPSANIVLRPFLRREAVDSSRIEGTITSIEQLALLELDPDQPAATRDTREVANYIRAMEQGLELLDEIPPSLRLIRALHKTLMTGVRGDAHQSGEFRNIQNWISATSADPARARYVPPPPEHVMPCLHQFENYMAEPSGWPPIVELALIHYQFEAIHPFEDGNGRIGRLLTTLLLSNWKLLEMPVLSLSAYMERNRREYVDALLKVSTNNNWHDWLSFFVAAVADQARDGAERAKRLVALREEYRERYLAVTRSAILMHLIDVLFENPVANAPYLSMRFEVSFPAAQNAINMLVGDGLLMEVTGRSRNRYFVAPEIVRATEI